MYIFEFICIFDMFFVDVYYIICKISNFCIWIFVLLELLYEIYILVWNVLFRRVFVFVVCRGSCWNVVIGCVGRGGFIVNIIVKY